MSSPHRNPQPLATMARNVMRQPESLAALALRAASRAGIDTTGTMPPEARTNIAQAADNKWRYDNRVHYIAQDARLLGEIDGGIIQNDFPGEVRMMRRDYRNAHKRLRVFK